MNDHRRSAQPDSIRRSNFCRLAAESEINLFLPKAYSHGGGLLDGGTTYVTASWGSESFFNYSTFRTEPAWGSL
jgi:hypothetical protein